MNIFQSFILGMVQGLSEFLPISSSAHLVLVPWLFGWKDPGLAFDIVLHLGTLAAVLAYFRRDVGLLIKGFIHSLSASTRDLHGDLHQKMAWFLVVASIPGAVAGGLLADKAETVFRNPIVIVSALAGFGLILLIVDRFGKKQRKLVEAILWDAILIGCSQAFAIVPGVSRSGATIAGGLGLGFQREDAARFSFLLSIPIIFGAGLAHVGNISLDIGWGTLLTGFLSSAFSGFISIKFLLRYVAKNSFGVFVWYRFVLAAVVLLIIYTRMT